MTSKLKEGVMQGVFTLCACVSILAVALICIFLFANGVPTLFKIGPLKFLLGTTWKPGNDIFGILPMILGSIYVTAGAILVGVPIGLLTAIYMSKFAPPRINKVMLPAVQLLAGIPSVVYGFFGMIVLVPAVQAMVKSPFFKTVLHVKSGKGMSLFTAAVLLGIMILPTIITVSKTSLDAVPDSYYEGSLALGATHERSVFSAVFPAARSGILAGIILGVGRAIGETMAAFTPDSVGALRYVQNFGIRTAGAESNVAVGLAKLGLEAAWVSRLGTDEFGCFIRNQLRAEGVDCSRVIYDPDHRTGIMFKETSVGETKVFYYRENSAASHLCPEDVTPALLDGVKVLHMSGITPVLSESCLAMTKAAFALAKEKGVAISFDPNIRRKLWRGQDYAPLIRELTLQSEIVLLGLDEADALFGLRDPDAIFDLLFRDGCAQYVAIKAGGNGAWVADKTTREKLPPYPCKPIEPIGAGDGFNAGFLAGILQGRDVVTAGRMGAICGALATQTPGDVEGYPDAAQMEAALTGAAITYR